MTATPKQRQAAHRARRAAQGLKRFELYAHHDDWPEIRALAWKLMRQRAAPLPQGERFTIEGFERDRRGRMLLEGRSVKTGRKCKPAGLMEFVLAPGAEKARK